MLVHDFALVSVPCVAITETLRAQGPGLLKASVDTAITASFGQIPFELDVGELRGGSEAFVLPFALHIEPRRAAFHRLEGDLEYFALGPSCCQLRLLASYGRTGPANPSRVDHARVETTMRAVLTHLARDLEAAGAMKPCHG